MKSQKRTISSVLITLLMCITFSNITAQTDTTRLRYIKFATTVNASISQISVGEIEAFYDGENIAKGSTVTANGSTYDPFVNEIVDGDKSSEWASDSYLTLTNDYGYGPTDNNPHYIVVDLGSEYNLESLKLNIDAMNFNYTFDFFVSQNAANWSLVDHKSTTHGVYTYTSIPIQNVRYIKYACYYSSDNGQVNVQEIQAYYNGVNVALNKTVTANSYEYGNASTNGKYAVDGSSSTRWSSNRRDHIVGTRAESAQVWVKADLNKIQTIDSLRICYTTGTVFSVYVSTDDNEWIKIDERLNEKNSYSYTLNRLPKVNSTLQSYSDSKAAFTVYVSSQGSSDITSRGICWSTEPEPTIADNKTSNGTGTGIFTATTTGLTPNTAYYSRAYATNAYGTKYSNETHFLNGLKIETDIISDVKNGQANCDGFITADNNIQITERGICWSTSANATIANQKSSCGSGTGSFRGLITGLTGGATYYVKAYTTTAEGTFYGEELSFKYAGNSYASNQDGYYTGYIFVESGTYGGQTMYVSQYGSPLFCEDGIWYIDGFVTSEESGNPPLTGWWDGTTLELIEAVHATVSYDKTLLHENTLNNGTIKETLIITHDNTNNAAFSGADNEDFIQTGKAKVRNLPDGLTAKIIRQNNLELKLSLSGTATKHEITDSVSNVTIMLTPSAFTDGNTSCTSGNLKNMTIEYIEPANVTVTGTKSSTDYSLTSDNNVTVDNNAQLNITAATEINQLTLNSGAGMTTGSPLTVNDVILKADDSNTFCLKLTNCITINNTLSFEKTMLDSKWYFLSFPCDVNTSDITMINGGVLDEDYYILTYDGAGRATRGTGSNWSHVTSGTLTAKKGYAFGLKTGIGTKTLAFNLNKTIAECETNDVNVPATYHNGSLGVNHKGWNLIGQPYLSKFTGCELGINYITIWNGNGYAGKAKDQVNCINPFEAFFVQVSTSDPISFSLSGRQSARSMVEKNNEELAEITIDSRNGSDNTTIMYNNKYNTTYEIGEDLEKWMSTNTIQPQLFSSLNDIKYAYNCIPESGTNNIRLGYFTKEAGECIIRASKIQLSGISGLLLTDHKTGTTTDLANNTYTFRSIAGSETDRFSITPQRISTVKDIQNNENTYAVTVKNSKLTIGQVNEALTIRIFDPTGKLFQTACCNGKTVFETTLPYQGIFVININSNKSSAIFKILNTNN